ncbi:hypothetical protein P7K49_013340 [Saguinus oedipus]|uniref:Uncharacterized protein n=1 Tax=Saguinus oedipus TaxID=9490 RepID=A0ABQ9VG66_SAGOE|nr:hypothetical protein P7K49_013340 [Saguinus oedipus]
MEEQRALVAAKDGDVAALERLLEAGTLGPGITDALGAGLVHHATRAGHLDCVKFLVQRAKLPGNQRAHNGATPAHDAAATGSLAELCWLVQEGGCGLQVSGDGAAWPPQTCWRGTREACGRQAQRTGSRPPWPWPFVSLGDSVPVPRLRKRKALSAKATSSMFLFAPQRPFRQVQGQQAGAVLLQGSILTAGPSEKAQVYRTRDTYDGMLPGPEADQDASGVSPLHLAARFGHPVLVEWLLHEGHSATLETREGALPLHHAAVSGDLTCLKLLTAAHGR